MKKVLCFILVVAFLVTFVACEKKAPETVIETSIVEVTKEVTVQVEKVLEPKTIDWMMREMGVTVYTNELKVYEYLGAAGNLTINPVMVAPDVYMEKLSVLVSSNTLPDIVNIGNQDLFIEAITPDFTLAKDIGPKGLLVSLTDNLKYLPHYKLWLDKWPEFAGGITSSDGKIYFASVVRNYSPTSSLGAVIRADKAQMTTFETFDDLYMTLEALRFKADGPIWTNRSGLLNLNLLSYSFGTSLMDFPYYDQYGKVFINPVATANFKDAVLFFQRLVAEDILTPEWVAYPEPQWYQDAMTDKCLFWVDNMMNVPTHNNGLKTNGLTGEFVAIVPPKYNGVFYGWAGKSRFSTTGSVISAKTDALDNILAMFDWTYDLSASHDILYWGEVGITCKQLPSGGYGNTSPGVQSTEAFGKLVSEIYGIGENSNWMKVFTDAEYFNDRAFDGARKWYPCGKVYGDNVYTYSVPAVSLGDASERFSELYTPISTYIQESVTAFINGQKSMDEWDAFVAKVSEMGADEAVAIYNSAIGK